MAFDVNRVASDQVTDALADLDRPAEAYLHFPWPALDGVVGGMPAGDIWFLAGFSGQGKTTFISSVVDAWYEEGRRIYWLGLESRGKTLRTHWACKRLGIDAGEVLTGKLKHMPNWAATREAVRAEIMSQMHGDKLTRVYISPVEFMGLDELERAADEACEMRADVVIIDHIDHIGGGDGTQLHSESVRVNQRLLSIAQDAGLTFLVATQLNNDAVRHDRLAAYQPPQPHHVYMGSHKRMIASGMLGICRTLRVGGSDPERTKLVRDGTLEPHEILEPNTMLVTVMKHRNNGAMEGKRCLLGVHNGRVRELDPEHARDIEARRNAIKTNRDVTPYGGRL